ncbi:MAG: flagellin FliC [Vicinamibacteraceae bacterium]|nr:flagellin FliC [Vicinamibacteraceae bacterium]
MASFSVVTNIASSNAQANLYSTQNGLKTALTRVSSGFRINYSGDDAAGLAVANSFRATVAILNQGVRNANDGLSDLQIKDGALDNISKLLDRAATLATQAASASTSDQSRATLDAEYQEIIGEVDREAAVAGLDGVTAFSVFVSADGADGKVGGSIGQADAATLGLAGDLLSAANAETAVGAITNATTGAIKVLGDVQGDVGALQNRLSYAISLAQSQIVNTKAAESRIRDANIAEESANLTRYSILNQSGIAALAQANASTSAVLALLQ